MSYTPDDIDKHELYMYVGGLPSYRQDTIKFMVERMNAIINESVRDGHIALGVLALELTGLSVVDVPITGKGH